MTGRSHNLVTLASLFFSALYVAEVTGKTYYVEINLVVDDAARHQFEAKTGKKTEAEFIEELHSFFYEANQLYSSLKSKSIDVKFILKNITLDAVDVVHNPFGVIGEEGLGQFKTWLNDKKPYEKTDYDLAMLLTGYDIVSTQTSGLLGFGMIGQVCSKRGVGMVEYRKGSYRDAFVLAHEIGHILGANHDGTLDNVGKECKPDGYIMTPNTDAMSTHHFKFSYCSYEYFYYHLNGKLPWECLDNGDAADVVKGKRMGTLMTADQSCQRDLDEDAFFDRARAWVYGDEVCTTLLCNRGDGELINTFAPQGLYCGKNKQCIQGKCIVTDEGKSDVPDNCPFGDAPKINYEGYKTCDELPLHHCGVMKHECCKRCNIDVLGEPDEVCRETEKNKHAQMYRKAYAKFGYGDTFCTWLACTTGDKDGKPQWRWTKTPPGLVCGANKRCQGGKCLPAKDGLPYLDDTCPFGDQGWVYSGTDNCKGMIPRYDDKHAACLPGNHGWTCCAYCKGK